MDNRCKALRAERKVSIEELARYCGVNKSTISKFERKLSVLNLVDCYKISNYFNVTLDYLMCLTNERQPSVSAKPVEKIEDYRFNIRKLIDNNLNNINDLIQLEILYSTLSIICKAKKDSSEDEPK